MGGIASRTRRFHPLSSRLTASRDSISALQGQRAREGRAAAQALLAEAPAEPGARILPAVFGSRLGTRLGLASNQQRSSYLHQTRQIILTALDLSFPGWFSEERRRRPGEQVPRRTRLTAVGRHVRAVASGRGPPLPTPPPAAPHPLPRATRCPQQLQRCPLWWGPADQKRARPPCARGKRAHWAAWGGDVTPSRVSFADTDIFVRYIISLPAFSLPPRPRRAPGSCGR